MQSNSTTLEKKLPSLPASIALVASCFLTTAVLAAILVSKGVISMNPAPGPFGNGTCYNDQSKPGEPVPCEAEGEGAVNLIGFSGILFAMLALIAWGLRVAHFNHSLTRQRDAGSIQELENGPLEHATATTDPDETTGLLRETYQPG